MRIFIKVIILLLLLWLAMTISGMRLNISQKLIQKGEQYPSSVAKNYGQVNEGQSNLVCGYFTGMAIVHTVFWYSPNNILGKDSCPIWTDNK